MRLLLRIVFYLVKVGLNLLYKYIDSDKDGKLDKREINKFIAKLRSLKK